VISTDHCSYFHHQCCCLPKQGETKKKPLETKKQRTNNEEDGAPEKALFFNIPAEVRIWIDGLQCCKTSRKHNMT